MPKPKPPSRVLQLTPSENDCRDRSRACGADGYRSRDMRDRAGAGPGYPNWKRLKRMKKAKPGDLKPQTRLVTAGRETAEFHGFVNPPVYHASTVLYPNAADMVAHRARYQYGRRGTPTSEALENALRELEGPDCAGVTLLPSGAAAVSTALLSVLSGRRSHPDYRQRLSPDPQFRRLDPQALRRRDQLLRSADRRRHRRRCSSRTPRGLRRGAGLAKLRDAGHSGHRRGRA